MKNEIICLHFELFFPKNNFLSRIIDYNDITYYKYYKDKIKFILFSSCFLSLMKII